MNSKHHNEHLNKLMNEANQSVTTSESKHHYERLNERLIQTICWVIRETEGEMMWIKEFVEYARPSPEA